MIDVTYNIDAIRDIATAIGLDDAEFARAADHAVRTTQRTLFRIGLAALAKAIGARTSSELKRRRRITGYVKRQEALIRINTDPVSMSALKPSAIRQIPMGFRIQKFGKAVFQRAREPLPSQFEADPTGFKHSSGRRDTIQRIRRRIESGGAEAAAQMESEAEALIVKNLQREIDQAIRRKQYAK